MKCPVPHVPHRYGFLGVQFRSLGALVINYDSSPTAKLVWCSLNKENRAKVDKFLYQNDEIPGQGLAKLMEKWNGTSYNTTCCCLDLCASVWSCCRGLQSIYSKFLPKVNNNGSQFCSEFNANIYKEVEILPSTVVANKVVPSDYLTTMREGKVAPVDVDGDVPMLYDSYITFTARSNLGKKVYLTDKFYEDLKPYPIIDENYVIPEKHIEAEETVSKLETKASVIDLPTWDSNLATESASLSNGNVIAKAPSAIRLVSVTDPDSEFMSKTSFTLEETSEYLRHINSLAEDPSGGEVNLGADLAEVTELPYPDPNKAFEAKIHVDASNNS